MNSPGANSERSLVLAPHGRDAEIAAAIVREAGLPADVVAGLGDLCAQIRAGAGLAIGVSGGGGAAARASVRHEILFRPRLDTHKGQQVAAVGGTPPEVTVEVSAVNTAGLPADVRVVCENARTLEFDGGLAKD